MHLLIKKLLPLSLVLSIAGCTNLSPNYTLPDAPIASNISGEDQVSETKSIKLKAWQVFFTNPNTRELIALALEHNRDLRIAAANVAEVQGLFQIQVQSLYPNVSGVGNNSITGNSKSLTGTDNTTRRYAASVGITSYEIDFWGRVRNLSDAALASYFSTLEAQRASKLTVISSTARAYSNWVAATQNLQLAEKTLNGRTEYFDLIQLRESIGIASALDLAQAEVAKLTVEAQRAQSQRGLSDAQAALELLVGTPIGKLLKSQTLGPRVAYDFVIPKNLSSQSILLRPDVIAAEEQLRSANANIGAARAAFFPSVSLTGSAGFASGDLNRLFSSDSRTWSFMPSLSIPLFGNANQANLDVANARNQKSVAQYEKAIQRAFSEVYSNFNNRVARGREIDANRRLVKAQQKRMSLAAARYDAGLSSYIEVLDAQQNLFSDQQSLLESERGEAASIIDLYRALGGGDELQQSFRSRSLKAQSKLTSLKE